jgi:lauroyl/myristoyl acyltransferase
LTHALQCERDYEGQGHRFHAESHEQDYKTGSIEREARLMAELLSPILQLVQYAP